MKTVYCLIVSALLAFTSTATAAGNKPNIPPEQKARLTSQLSTGQLIVFRLMDLWWEDMVPEGVPTKQSGDIVDFNLVKDIETDLEELFEAVASGTDLEVAQVMFNVTVSQIEQSLLEKNFINSAIYREHFEFIHSTIESTINLKFPSAETCSLLLNTNSKKTLN